MVSIVHENQRLSDRIRKITSTDDTDVTKLSNIFHNPLGGTFHNIVFKPLDGFNVLLASDEDEHKKLSVRVFVVQASYEFTLRSKVRGTTTDVTRKHLVLGMKIRDMMRLYRFVYGVTDSESYDEKKFIDKVVDAEVLESKTDICCVLSSVFSSGIYCNDDDRVRRGSTYNIQTFANIIVLHNTRTLFEQKTYQYSDGRPMRPQDVEQKTRDIMTNFFYTGYDTARMLFNVYFHGRPTLKTQTTTQFDPAKSLLNVLAEYHPTSPTYSLLRKLTRRPCTEDVSAVTYAQLNNFLGARYLHLPVEKWGSVYLQSWDTEEDCDRLRSALVYIMEHKKHARTNKQKTNMQKGIGTMYKYNTYDVEKDSRRQRGLREEINDGLEVYLEEQFIDDCVLEEV